MTLAHIHLMAVHFPSVGTALAIPLLVLAWWRLDRGVYLAAATVLAISGLAAALALGTGDSAEDLVEHLPDVASATVEAHEEAAELAATLTIVDGFVALVVLALASRRRALPAFGVAAVLLGTVASAGSLARTASLGGQIRHTELAPQGVAASVQDDDAD